MGLFGLRRKEFSNESSRAQENQPRFWSYIEQEAEKARSREWEESRQKMVAQAKEVILKRTKVGAEYRGGIIVKKSDDRYGCSSDAFKELIDERIFVARTSKSRRTLYVRAR